MDNIRFGAPCSMCGGASGHPADGSGCDRPVDIDDRPACGFAWQLRDEAYRCLEPAGHNGPHVSPNPDILASGPIRPGYQHSPATYVEGREAPKRPFACPARSDGSNHCAMHLDERGEGACCWCGTLLAGAFSPAIAHGPHVPAPDAATVEACAMAAEETWLMLCNTPGMERMSAAARWGAIGRAVLAAAGRGGK